MAEIASLGVQKVFGPGQKNANYNSYLVVIKKKPNKNNKLKLRWMFGTKFALRLGRFDYQPGQHQFSNERDEEGYGTGATLPPSLCEGCSYFLLMVE